MTPRYSDSDLVIPMAHITFDLKRVASPAPKPTHPTSPHRSPAPRNPLRHLSPTDPQPSPQFINNTNAKERPAHHSISTAATLGRTHRAGSKRALRAGQRGSTENADSLQIPNIVLQLEAGRLRRELVLRVEVVNAEIRPGLPQPGAVAHQSQHLTNRGRNPSTPWFAAHRSIRSSDAPSTEARRKPSDTTPSNTLCT